MLLYLNRPFYNILLPHIKIYFDGYQSIIIIVVSTEDEEGRKVKIIIVKIKIIKDDIPEREVITQVLENAIFILK